MMELYAPEGGGFGRIIFSLDRSGSGLCWCRVPEMLGNVSSVIYGWKAGKSSGFLLPLGGKVFDVDCS